MMKLNLKTKVKAAKAKVGVMVKELGTKARHKAKAVDWKKVGKGCH